MNDVIFCKEANLNKKWQSIDHPYLLNTVQLLTRCVGRTFLLKLLVFLHVDQSQYPHLLLHTELQTAIVDHLCYNLNTLIFSRRFI
jgi:hypothetical protein